MSKSHLAEGLLAVAGSGESPGQRQVRVMSGRRHWVDLPLRWRVLRARGAAPSWGSGARNRLGDRPGELAGPGPVSAAGRMEAVLGEEAVADYLRVHRDVPVSG